MFDTNVDTLYVWVAVGAVSVAVFGIVTQLPTSAPPDGAAVAGTIDEVATSPPGSVAKRSLTAVEWSLRNGQFGLRSDGGTVHEPILNHVAPAVNGSLELVLESGRPSAVFDSPAAFERAVERARTGGTGWRPAPDRLTIRHVAWGGVDVTLVG